MATIEEKKLIVEFMDGLWNVHSKKYGIGNATYCDYGKLKNVVRAINHYSIDELKYDSSWDWIMPVVEKIDKVCGIDLHEWDNSVNEALITKNINIVYREVIAFIKWYNETEYFHEDKIKSMLKNGEVKEAIEYAEKNNIDAVAFGKLSKGIDIDLPF